MPSTVTHEYYYRDVYKRTSKQFKNTYPEDEYRKYSAFAQGHDALFFSKFWEIHKHGQKREIIHNLGNNRFKELVLEVIKLARERGLIDRAEVKLWLYGYILHHILDSYAHPYIFYMSETDGLHAEVESFLDQEIIRRKEWSDPHKFKVHKLICSPPKLSEETTNLIDDAFKNIYGYENFGKMYVKALDNVHIFLRLFRYDPFGIKKLGYSIIDKTHISHTTFAWLSYKRRFDDYSEYLNEEKKTWGNPLDPSLESNKSFMEIYEDAVQAGAKLISELEEAFLANDSLDKIASIIPDRSAIHGLECGRQLEFVNLREGKQDKK